MDYRTFLADSGGTVTVEVGHAQRERTTSWSPNSRPFREPGRRPVMQDRGAVDCEAIALHFTDGSVMTIQIAGYDTGSPLCLDVEHRMAADGSCRLGGSGSPLAEN